MVTMYGIKNCDTIQKARKWLEGNKVTYSFHDYKTSGIDEGTLRGWIADHGWETLLNRGGTTFRALHDVEKSDIDTDKAVMLMLANPSMIKRPILDVNGKTIVGFKSSTYEAALAGVMA
jgi:arsenate reductase